MSDSVVPAPLLPAKAVLFRICCEQATKTQQCLHPLTLEGKGTSHPVTSAGLPPDVQCFETTTTHLSSLFMTLTFPFSMSSWFGCNFPSQSSLGSSQFHTIFQDTAETTTGREKPCGSLGDLKTLPHCCLSEQSPFLGKPGKMVCIVPRSH